MVGGRALEEEEEGAEELVPLAGNFAFYHTKASEYPEGPTAPTQGALRPWGGVAEEPRPQQGREVDCGGPCEPLCLQPQP